MTAADYVTLPDDYADITISADLGQVSDDDINDYIDSNVLSNFATTNEVKDRAAADGAIPPARPLTSRSPSPRITAMRT